MNDIVKRDFNQINLTHKVMIPDIIENVVVKLNGLGIFLTASDWCRSAMVKAWVEKDKGSGGREVGESSPTLSMRKFAKLGIRGLSTKNAVRHYWHAWENTNLPTPMPGEEIILPDESFPEWGTITDMGGTKSSTGNVWYTPEKYIESACKVMGNIDLDPATDENANKIIKAKNIITEEDEPDGLNQEWYGNVWLNPPYGKGSGKFSNKLLNEYNSGRVKAAILLLNAYGFDSIWFQPLWQFPICFTDHRIIFVNPDKESGGPANANIFIYMGEQRELFKNVFSEYGHIMILWE